jgi:Ca2+-binding EF-hand superfamily protein
MKLILTLTALFVSASLVMSADEPKKPEEGKGKRPSPEEFFKKLDANGDGSVSKDEYLASPRAKQDPAKAGENFAKMDKDNDGKLTKEEFAAMAKARGNGKGKKPEAK